MGERWLLTICCGREVVVDRLVWERGGGWPSDVGERWLLTVWCGREVVGGHLMWEKGGC